MVDRTLRYTVSTSRRYQVKGHTDVVARAIFNDIGETSTGARLFMERRAAGVAWGMAVALLR